MIGKLEKKKNILLKLTEYSHAVTDVVKVTPLDLTKYFVKSDGIFHWDLPSSAGE